MACWINRVEHRLQRRMRYGPNKIQSGFQKTADGLEHVFRFIQRSRVAPHDSAHLSVMEVFREWRSRRHSEKNEEPTDVVPGFRNELAIPAHHLRCLLEFPEHGAGIVCVDLVRLKQKRRHDSEVPATAADRPE